jgi:hypothetical protein
MTLNSKKLGELVSAQVTAGTKKLQAKIARLENALPKNQTGAQKSSAAKKKKKTDQKTTPKVNAAARKAAAAAKDTAAAKGKSDSGTNKTRKKKFSTKGTQRTRP